MWNSGNGPGGYATPTDPRKRKRWFITASTAALALGVLTLPSVSAAFGLEETETDKTSTVVVVKSADAKPTATEQSAPAPQPTPTHKPTPKDTSSEEATQASTEEASTTTTAVATYPTGSETPIVKANAGTGKDDPPGNNGTVKIDGTDIKSGDNDPHVGCVFSIDWFQFDNGATSTVTFELQSPTADSQTLTVKSGDLTKTLADGNGTETYTLAFTGNPHPVQGYHVKVTVETSGSKGADNKHKTFWVLGCTPATPPPSETPSPSPSVTVSETPSPSPSVTETPSPSPSVTVSETPSPSPSVTETPSPTPSATDTETPSPSPSVTETPSPSSTPTPTATSTATATPSATSTPSSKPSECGGEGQLACTGWDPTAYVAAGTGLAGTGLVVLGFVLGWWEKLYLIVRRRSA